MSQVETYYQVEILKDGRWISTSISDSNLQVINQKLVDFLASNQVEYRIIQRAKVQAIKPRRKGCC